MFSNKIVQLFLVTLLVAAPSIDAKRTGVRGENNGATRRFLDESADEASGDSKDSKGKDSSDMMTRSIGPTVRDCTVKEDADEMKFECKAKTEDASGTEFEDKIKFKVATKKSKSLKVKVEYEQEVETETTETETETQFTVVFDRLLEYRKGSADTEVARAGHGGGTVKEEYEWGVDTVVAEWPLDTWSDFTPLEEVGSMKSFSATALDIATFTFKVHQDASADIDANKMKIDFLLEDYPWDASGDTFVALICHVETEKEVDIESEGDEEDVAMDVLISFDEATDAIGFVPFGEYTWAETAEARALDMNATETNSTATAKVLKEAETIKVVATTSPKVESEATEEEPTYSFNEIAFSFVGAGQGAASIYWDPEAGVGYAEGESASAAYSLFGPLAISLGSVLVALALN